MYIEDSPKAITFSKDYPTYTITMLSIIICITNILKIQDSQIITRDILYAAGLFSSQLYLITFTSPNELLKTWMKDSNKRDILTYSSSLLSTSACIKIITNPKTMVNTKNDVMKGLSS